VTCTHSTPLVSHCRECIADLMREIASLRALADTARLVVGAKTIEETHDHLRAMQARMDAVTAAHGVPPTCPRDEIEDVLAVLSKDIRDMERGTRPAQSARDYARHLRHYLQRGHHHGAAERYEAHR
jgi:hypothetical protein